MKKRIATWDLERNDDLLFILFVTLALRNIETVINYYN